MKVLVVGGGGREHALCWKLRQSPLLDDLYCAPGNPGISQVADPVSVSAEDIQGLADFARDLAVDLTIVGPELPLTLGLVDEFRSRGLGVFGPRRTAAELEGSKVFAKEFMRRHDIPTGDFVVTHERKEAQRAAKEFGFPVVLKADGLAAGKGVLIVRDGDDLERALDVFFEERKFGASGDRVLVEEHLTGEEVSLIGLSDGKNILPLATSKDYKRLLDDDRGPNTGGMGSHSPSGVLGSGDAAVIMEKVMRPVISGLADEGRPFKGFLYAGMMLTPNGPRVLEFNVRLGDPEAQCILLRLKDDLLPVLAQAAEGEFRTERLEFRKEAAVCLVMAADGYPDRPVKGDVILGLEQAGRLESVEVFHAGTALDNGRVVVAGGRVLNVCATGHDMRDALRRAYRATSEIQWPNAVLRRDIGRRVLERSAS
jgi:phosphoribosylamine--glycine ligase